MRKIILLLLIATNTTFAMGKWECVDRMVTCHTWRLWTPEGWIISGESTEVHGYAMTYVPDKNHEWKL